MKRFETEDYFGRYEFSQPYLLAASDCETISIAELIELGGGSIETLSATRLGYPTMEGSEELRRAISSLYATVQANDVMVLGAPMEGIYITMRTLVAPGDHVVVLAPAYDALLNLPAEMTTNVSRWHLRREAASWRLDLEALERILEKDTRLLVINFPHNPTGYYPSWGELNDIVRLCRARRVTIFSDEMYRGLEYTSDDVVPSVADIDETAITLRGASKSMGLPGLRLGWLTVKDRATYRDILNTKTYTSICSAQASEYLGLMAVTAAEKLVARNRTLVLSNLERARVFFSTWNDLLRWVPPRAGSVFLVELLEGSAEAFCERMASEHGVVLLPSKFMGCPGEYFRMGLGRQNFGDCLAAFDQALTVDFGRDTEAVRGR